MDKQMSAVRPGQRWKWTGSNGFLKTGDICVLWADGNGCLWFKRERGGEIAWMCCEYPNPGCWTLISDAPAAAEPAVKVGDRYEYVGSGDDAGWGKCCHLFTVIAVGETYGPTIKCDCGVFAASETCHIPGTGNVFRRLPTSTAPPVAERPPVGNGITILAPPEVFMCEGCADRPAVNQDDTGNEQLCEPCIVIAMANLNTEFAEEAGARRAAALAELRTLHVPGDSAVAANLGHRPWLYRGRGR